MQQLFVFTAERILVMSDKIVLVKFINEDSEQKRVRLRQKVYAFKMNNKMKPSKFAYVIVPNNKNGYSLAMISGIVAKKDMAKYQPTARITKKIRVISSLRTAKNGYSGWKKLNQVPDYLKAKNIFHKIVNRLR